MTNKRSQSPTAAGGKTLVARLKDTMKDIKTTLVFITLFTQTVISFGQTKNKWKSYAENLNTRLTIQFSYPDYSIVNSEENSRCLIAKHNISNIDWCIWLTDSSETSVGQSISDERTFFKGITQVISDTVLIDSIKCLRVTIKSSLTREQTRQLIFLTKLGTTFEIINRSGTNSDFDKFYSTITLHKTDEKPSH